MFESIRMYTIYEIHIHKQSILYLCSVGLKKQNYSNREPTKLAPMLRNIFKIFNVQCLWSTIIRI